MVLDILESVSKLGVPMMLMSWWVYSWLYRTDRLDPQGSRKEHELQLKNMREQRKREKGLKADKSNDVKNDPEDFWLQKWMWFGGGFYGMAALWTLIVVEVIELINFVTGLPVFIANFVGGPMDLVIQFLLNQLANLITAVVWFTYWDGGFSLTWFAVAYFGYLGGRELAKRMDAKQSWQHLRQRVAELQRR